MTSGGEDLYDRVLAGDIRAGARLMRDLDDGMPAARDLLRRLYPRTGRAFVLGVTGNPGSGKSTLVDALILRYRALGKRVGVVAVDPSSPFTGGAILGDRIRMQRHFTDPDVFIRSLATRGHLGGLSRSTADVIAVLDVMGYDIVLLETVGVGQDEVDVISLAHTAVVVTVPGLGDDIQAIKAGIMEIADVLVVNKADREGSDGTVRDLVHMLQLRSPGKGAPKEVEIIKTVATRGTGLDELLKAIDDHREQTTGEEGKRRAVERAMAQLGELIKQRLVAAAESFVASGGGLEELAARVVSRERDPYGLADEVVAGMLPHTATSRGA